MGRGSNPSDQHLREVDDRNEFYLLAHAHICLIGKRLEEAKWLLESYNYNRLCHR